MPNFSTLTNNVVISAFRKVGFPVAWQKGSHVQMQHIAAKNLLAAVGVFLPTAQENVSSHLLTVALDIFL